MIFTPKYNSIIAQINAKVNRRGENYVFFKEYQKNSIFLLTTVVISVIIYSQEAREKEIADGTTNYKTASGYTPICRKR